MICEECWEEAYFVMMAGGEETQTDIYNRLVKERDEEFVRAKRELRDDADE